MKFRRFAAAAFCGALGVFVSGSAEAVIVNLEYTGVVTRVEAESSFNEISSPYVGSATNNYVDGGLNFGPTITSPALSASITIGASTFAIPLADSICAEIVGRNDGTIAGQTHEVDVTSSIFFYNSILDHQPF